MSLVFVINLASEKKRREYITKHLADCGIEAFTVIDAVCGETLSADTIAQRYSKRLNKKHYWHPLTREEIGCVLSHLSCYRQLLNSDQQGAFIFEDDMECPNMDLAQAMHVIETSKLPANALCLLHGVTIKNDHMKVHHQENSKYQLTEVIQSLNFTEEYAYLSHSYYIKRQTAKILLAAFGKIYTPIDIWHMHCDRFNIPLFFIIPACTQQNLDKQLCSAIEGKRCNIQTKYALRYHIWLYKYSLKSNLRRYLKSPHRISLLKDMLIIMMKFYQHLLVEYLNKRHPRIYNYLKKQEFRTNEK